ncbi:MAG: RagB/SusD family nutrient uptake outer membrane protein [Ginsengibacter sp.]
MKINKIIAVLVMGALFVVSSCKKNFLEVPPQGQQPAEQFWTSESDATKAVNSIYANLRGWTEVAFAPIAIESLGSDDTETGSDPSDGSVPFMNTYNNFTVTSTQGQLSDFWNGRYQTINLCNQVIDNIQPIAMDANSKSRYIAEAKFIRAYEYFRLVRAFGDVPLRLSVPKDATEYNLPRTAKAQVWAAVEQDLTDAAGVLPNSYTGADVGRATKGAALAFHAKAAMYQAKWADVKTYTEQVMALGYALFPDYEQLFRIQNENNSESIFEIQAKHIPGNCDASNSQYSQVQGVRSVARGGWGFHVPTSDLSNSYEPGDPRKDGTIIFRGETTPEGNAIPSTVPNPMYNQKSYVPFNDPNNQDCNEGSDQNIRVMRYAEVLLMNAEANNELGNPAPALVSLEKVRARARGGNNLVLPPITTTDKAALRTAIWNERRAELAMEFDRYFDVIRQGRGAVVFGPLGWKASKNEVWPVPQSEIDLSAGTLTQNPGY